MTLKLSKEFKKLISRKRASNCEKIVGALLELNNVEFYIEKVFKGLPNRRFDFYLPESNTVVEVHGEQHYKQSTLFGNLEDIKESDRIKKEYAEEKGITYIEIPAKRSEIPTIRNSIKRTKLNYLLKNVDEHVWKDYSILEEDKTKLPSIEILDIVNNLRSGNSITTDTYLEEEEEKETLYINRLNKVSIPGEVKCLTTKKLFNDIQDACDYYSIEYSELKEGATYYKHEGKMLILSRVE